MPSTRFERVTPGLGILCSIHLSYEGVKEYQLLTFVGRRKCYHLLPFCYHVPKIRMGQGLESPTLAETRVWRGFRSLLAGAKHRASHGRHGACSLAHVEPVRIDRQRDSRLGV